MLLSFRQTILDAKTSLSLSSVKDTVNITQDLPESADQSHNSAKVTEHKDGKPSEPVDNLAIHGITLEPKRKFPNLKLRSDILSLPRNKMIKELLDNKRKAKDRSYVSSEEPSDLKLSFENDIVKVQVNLSDINLNACNLNKCNQFAPDPQSTSSQSHANQLPLL